MITLAPVLPLRTACADAPPLHLADLLAEQVYGCDYQRLVIQYYENAEVGGPFSGAFFPPPAGAPGACCTYTLFLTNYSNLPCIRNQKTLSCT